MQPRDKAAAVHFLAAGGSVTEPDDVGATLPQASGKGKPLGVVAEGHEADLVVHVVAHE